MIEPTDEMVQVAEEAAHDHGVFLHDHQSKAILTAVLALVERDQPFARAEPGEDACGKSHPDRRYTCQRRARHDVCLSWEAGNGVDAWHVDYDAMADEIEALKSTGRKGYETAIAVLRGVADRTGSPAANWCADYLLADPDRLAPPPQ